MIKLYKIIVLFGLILFAGGCKNSDFNEFNFEENNFVIAQVDSSTNIMASDLYKRLMKSKVLKEGGYLDSSTYFDTLFRIVVESVASVEAWNVRVEDDWEQYRRFKDEFQQLYVNYLFDKIIIEPIDIDTPQVTEYYQSHLNDFKLPQQFRASHLMISAEGLRYGEDSAAYKDFSDEQLDSISQSLLTKYRGMIDSVTTFGDLAFQYSMHRGSGEKFGDLGYFQRRTYASEFEAVVCTLGIGDVSYPFKTRDGWHLAQLTDFIDSTTLPLDTVYEKAYNQLLTNIAREKSIQFIDSINSSARFEFNDSVLKIPATVVPDTVWAAIVNERDTIDFFGLSEFLFDYKKALRLDSLTLDDIKTGLKRKAGPIIIMQAGDELGYADDSAIVAQRKELYHRYAKRIIGLKSFDPGYTPDDSLIEDYYNRNIEKYIIKKPVNVQHIIVEDSIFGEFLRDQALSGVDFLDLAKEHYPGAEEIRVAAADLGYIGPNEMPGEFYKMALRTAKGDVSHPVKTEWGYHIIHVVDKQLNKTLEEVHHQIAGVLRKEHQKEIRKKWRQDLMNGHTVTYYLDKLKKLKLPPFAERKQ